MRCKQIYFCVSQGSAATLLRRGGRVYNFIMRSLHDSVHQKLLKSVHFCRVIQSIKRGTDVFLRHSVYAGRQYAVVVRFFDVLSSISPGTQTNILQTESSNSLLFQVLIFALLLPFSAPTLTLRFMTVSVKHSRILKAEFHYSDLAQDLVYTKTSRTVSSARVESRTRFRRSRRNLSCRVVSCRAGGI